MRDLNDIQVSVGRPYETYVLPYQTAVGVMTWSTGGVMA